MIDKRTIYWNRAAARHKRIISKWTPVFQQALQADMQKFFEDYELHGNLITAGEVNRLVTGYNMAIATIGVWIYSGLISANTIYSKLKQYGKQEKFKDAGFNNKWVDDVLAKLKEHLNNKVTDNTRSKLLNILSKSITQGLSISDTVRMITDAGLAGTKRAKMIARTEIVSASNAGSMLAARESELVLTKEWISTKDLRTRTWARKRDKGDHVYANGQTVTLDEKFELRNRQRGPEFADFPGDPVLSAANRVNCRCTVGFVPQRDASGALMTKPNIPAPAAPPGQQSGGNTAQVVGNMINNVEPMAPPASIRQDVQDTLNSINILFLAQNYGYWEELFGL